MQSITSGPIHCPIILTQVKWTLLCVLHAKTCFSPWLPKHDEWRIVVFPPSRHIFYHNDESRMKCSILSCIDDTVCLLGNSVTLSMNGLLRNR